MADADGSRTLDIIRLGAQGDGVASRPEGPSFVPFALPGEQWRETGDGAFKQINAMPERIEPVCPHFGTCGGCVAQHMSDALYAEWKTGLVSQALAHQGIDIALQPLWRAAPGSRRRVVLSAEGVRDRIAVGFRAAGSHDLVEISDCAIADAEIVRLLPVLRGLLALVAGGAPLPSETRVHVLKADNGTDVFVDGAKGELSAPERAQLAKLAQEGHILRLRVGQDEIFQSAQPVLQVAGCEIRVPAGVFVQAVTAAETAMAAIVVKALGRSKHVADLFCGLGTFTLPIAQRTRVLAVDNQTDAVAALEGAVRHAQGLKPVEVLRRDLFREPLSRGELKPFDAVVFDPPRAGATAQAQAIAKSKVPVVVAVSCNPGTMARDLRTLIDGGYTLQSVVPIDQFLFSAHVEAVAVLRR